MNEHLKYKYNANCIGYCKCRSTFQFHVRLYIYVF